MWKEGVDVEISRGLFEKWYGAIIGHGLYNALADTAFESLSIKYNQFANCSTQATMSFANLDGFHIEDNNTLKQYSATHFIELRGNGVPFDSARKAVIDHVSYVGQFTQLVGLSTKDKRFHQSGLHIIDRKQSSNDNIFVSGFELINPAKWPIGDWTTSGDGYLDNIFKISKIDKTNVNKSIIFDLKNHKALGVNTLTVMYWRKVRTGHLTGYGLKLILMV